MRELEDKIFSINNDSDFIEIALQIFDYQYKNNPVYRSFVDYRKVNIHKINSIAKIPFLPIECFKYHCISTKPTENFKHTFISSGTTSSTTSKHHVFDISLYERSFSTAFKNFYGAIDELCFLALLPIYLERQGSSLIYMVDYLIHNSKNPSSGYYLYNHQELVEKIEELENKGQKTLLIGVSYALLDLAEHLKLNLKNTIVMETGGMKGVRKELIRNELHKTLCSSFGVNKIHSEYGMTELFSQAYSTGDGIFSTPKWMQIHIRDMYDPLTELENGKTGGISIVDLANLYSCSFIETMDLGRKQSNECFEILGRFDNSDTRGCNLMVI